MSPPPPPLSGVCLTLLLAALVGSARAGCSSLDTSRYIRHVGTVNSGANVQLRVLGVGVGVEVTCLSLVETPQKVGCETPSVIKVCRNSVMDWQNCQSLSEFIHKEEGKVVFGNEGGTEFTWILAFDGRGKPQECYPRAIELEMLLDLKKAEGGTSSKVVSVIAVVAVVLILLCIGCILGFYFMQRTTADRAQEVPEHQMTVVEGDEPPAELAGPEYDDAPPPHQQQHDPSYYQGPRNPIGPAFDPPPLYQTEQLPVVVGSPQPPTHTPPPPSPLGQYQYPRHNLPPPAYPEKYVEPLYDGTAMLLACNDCNRQIGHPNTPARCAVTGRLHPHKVVT